eukprot:GHVU01058321.1.p1 GENE.GHVU01058321.1~~GHVU01058321.1.p1  ORF type:complete len:217 (+),score=9.33 GHVU01058321.1:654-1304(+)
MFALRLDCDVQVRLSVLLYVSYGRSSPLNHTDSSFSLLLARLLRLHVLCVPCDATIPLPVGKNNYKVYFCTGKKHVTFTRAMLDKKYLPKVRSKYPAEEKENITTMLYNDAVLSDVLVAALLDHDSQLVMGLGSSVKDGKSSIYIRLQEDQKESESRWTRLTPDGVDKTKYDKINWSPRKATQVVVAKNEVSLCTQWKTSHDLLSPKMFFPFCRPR